MTIVPPSSLTRTLRSHLNVQVHLDLLRLGDLALRDPLVDLRLELVVGNDVLVLEPVRGQLEAHRSAGDLRNVVEGVELLREQSRTDRAPVDCDARHGQDHRVLHD